MKINMLFILLFFGKNLWAECLNNELTFNLTVGCELNEKDKAIIASESECTYRKEDDKKLCKINEKSFNKYNLFKNLAIENLSFTIDNSKNIIDLMRIQFKQIDKDCEIAPKEVVNFLNKPKNKSFFRSDNVIAGKEEKDYFWENYYSEDRDFYLSLDCVQKTNVDEKEKRVYFLFKTEILIIHRNFIDSANNKQKAL